MGSPRDQTCTGTWAGPRTVVVWIISMRSSSTVHSGWRVSISSITTAPSKPGQGGAEAEVGAVPEGHVAVHVPRHVEGSGSGYSRSSRPAEPLSSAIFEPAGTVTP